MTGSSLVRVDTDEASYTQMISAAYANCSVLFADAPDTETLEQLYHAAISHQRDEFCGDAERSFYSALMSCIGSDIHASRVAIASEYAELFVGPRPPLAPPFESVYLGFPNRLFTDQTMKVRSWYYAYGVQALYESRIPDDHIALELEFVSMLAKRCVESLEQGDYEEARNLTRQRLAFLEQHLAVWITYFAQRVEQAKLTGFYAATTAYVIALIEEDIDFLRALND